MACDKNTLCRRAAVLIGAVKNRKPPTMAPQPPPANDQWRMDPSDVGRHRRRMREANRRTPLGTFARLGAAVLALALIITAYLNFDTVRQVRLDFSEITALFDRGSRPPGAPTTPADEAGEPGTEVVEGGGVAGVAMPSAIGGAPPAPAEAPAAAPAEPAPAVATEAPYVPTRMTQS